MSERRRFLRGTAAAAGLGLAGCLGGLGGFGGDDTDTTQTFVDDCSDLSELAPAADTDRLGTDTTNTENFERPDGSTDGARLNRTGTTDDAALVYDLDGELDEVTAEFHWHTEAGGDLAVAESTDGGESWTRVDAERVTYGGEDNAWLHAEVSAVLSGSVDAVRLTLTGGDEPWSGQVGHVTIAQAGADVTPAGTAEPTPTPTALPTMTPVDGSASDVVFDEFVETDGTDFVVDGDPAYFSGGNHPQVSRLDGGITAADWLDTWLDLVPDLNVLRVPAFGEGQANYLQPEPGEYNERAFRLLDRVVYQFGARGVRLVMPLSNYWDWRGGIPQYVAWGDDAESKGDFYTDEQLVGWFRDFVEYLLERENTVTGVRYRDDPTIMLWELGNEPRAGSVDYDAYHEWVESTSEFIKSVDDNHLVSTGMEGFYGFDGPAGQDETRYVETHQIDAIDACTFHMYPDAWGLSDDQAIEWITRHTEEANQEVGKPSYLGEFGYEVDRTDDVSDAAQIQGRNRTLETWYETLVEAETDGAMVWDLRTEAEYESTSSWNRHAIYPRDEGTVELVGQYTQELTSFDESNE